jgi:hypothetical protein
MTTRREFLQGTMAASGIALAGTTSASTFSGLAVLSRDAFAPLQLGGIVFDTSIAHSVAFGSRANHLGLQTFPIEGDITNLWTRHLMGQWREQPVPLAGLTEAMPLFLLERFGWDHGLRVAFRAEHRPQDGGVLVHQLEGPPDMLIAFQSLAVGRLEFGSCMADAVASCPQTAHTTTTAMFTTPAVARESRQTLPLYSWVIAPRAAFAPLLP